MRSGPRNDDFTFHRSKASIARALPVIQKNSRQRQHKLKEKNLMVVLLPDKYGRSFAQADKKRQYTIFMRRTSVATPTAHK
ncbi:hypothetical protein ACT7DA_04110 [Bacillus pacificus]